MAARMRATAKSVKWHKYKYRYKHKQKLKLELERKPKPDLKPEGNKNAAIRPRRPKRLMHSTHIERVGSQNASCDLLRGPEAREAQADAKQRRPTCLRADRWPTRGSPVRWSRLIASLSLLTLLLQQLPSNSEAFCPPKCLCDDQSLSANCTRSTSLTTIPISLNPSLRRLSLNHLPLFELSNSLSVYRQLEYLNLNWNQLRHIQYESFNFRPAPAAAGRLLTQPVATGNNQHQLNLAKQSRLNQLLSELPQSSSEDEIGFHLRELHLADNKIERLGDTAEIKGQEVNEETQSTAGEQELPVQRAPSSGQLEQLAPFLTLHKLELLNLAGNRLRRLHRHAFLGLFSLKRLDLSQNQLEFVDRHAFVGLVELRWLQLENNRLARQLSQLGVALCRAPMAELVHLDLSDNYYSPKQQQQQLGLQQAEEPSLPVAAQEAIQLPNQVFLCTPKLISLRLEALQLRYIQVNAFDNLQALQQLSLARNNLEHLPTDSFSYSNSNISHSLKQLDLSETLIEFVNARSLAGLRNLQKLNLSSMERLVSFDVCAFHMRPESLQDEEVVLPNWRRRGHISPQPMQAALNEPDKRMKDDVWNRTAQFATSTTGIVSGSPASIINHASGPHEAAKGLQLMTNDQLVDLQLRNNRRLQSVHCSLVQPASGGVWAESRAPNGPVRVRFVGLRSLDLSGAGELRELALDQLVNLAELDHELRLDLSLAGKLNCSACSTGWLVEAARRQRSQPAPQGGPQQQTGGRLQVSPADGIGCVWPFVMALGQLVDLESRYASMLAGPAGCRQAAPSAHLSQPQPQPQPQPEWPGLDGQVLRAPGLRAPGPANQLEAAGAARAEPGWLRPNWWWSPLGLLLLLLGLGVLSAKMLLRGLCGPRARPGRGYPACWAPPGAPGTHLAAQRPFGPDWWAAAAAAAAEAEGRAGGPSPAGCSASSILSAGGPPNGLYGCAPSGPKVGSSAGFGPLRAFGNSADQIEHAHRAANLFSRIAGRWRPSRRPSSPTAGPADGNNSNCAATARASRPAEPQPQHYQRRRLLGWPDAQGGAATPPEGPPLLGSGGGGGPTAGDKPSRSQPNQAAAEPPEAGTAHLFGADWPPEATWRRPAGWPHLAGAQPGARAGPLAEGQTGQVGGHIYVTLDRPIRRGLQDGAAEDEYGNAQTFKHQQRPDPSQHNKSPQCFHPQQPRKHSPALQTKDSVLRPTKQPLPSQPGSQEEPPPQSAGQLAKLSLKIGHSPPGRLQLASPRKAAAPQTGSGQPEPPAKGGPNCPDLGPLKGRKSEANEGQAGQDNVTGHTDYGTQRQHYNTRSEPASQLFMAPNGPQFHLAPALPVRPSQPCQSGKYDANHGPLSTTNNGQTHSWAPNRLHNNGSGQRAPNDYVINGLQLRSAAPLGFPPSRPQSGLIGQHQQQPQQQQQQQQQLQLPLQLQLQLQGASAYAKQKSCDSQLGREEPDGATLPFSAGTIISAGRPLGSADPAPARDSRTTSSARSAPSPTSESTNNNEIYSNQFYYYCKPARGPPGASNGPQPDG